VVLLGTALLAYGLGLRHAVDADHIAAIDNVTRKLMQEGKRPIGAGFFFALGHSSVVIVAATAIALTAGGIQSRFPGLIESGKVIKISLLLVLDQFLVRSCAKDKHVALDTRSQPLPPGLIFSERFLLNREECCEREE